MKTQNEVGHTPTPWQIIRPIDGPPLTIRRKEAHAQEPNIAYVNRDLNSWRSEEMCQSNAEFIVRAVNSHEELLRALKGLLSAYAWDYKKTPQNELQSDVKKAVKAIAKAEDE